MTAAALERIWVFNPPDATAPVTTAPLSWIAVVKLEVVVAEIVADPARLI
jgi:hypothetical protein